MCAALARQLRRIACQTWEKDAKLSSAESSSQPPGRTDRGDSETQGCAAKTADSLDARAAGPESSDRHQSLIAEVDQRLEKLQQACLSVSAASTASKLDAEDCSWHDLVERLRAQLEAQKGDSAALAAEREACQEAQAQLEVITEELRRSSEERQAVLLELEATRQQLSAMEDALQAPGDPRQPEVAELSRLLSSAQQTSQERADALADAQQEGRLLRSERESLQRRLAEAERSGARLRSEMDAARTQLGDARSQLERSEAAQEDTVRRLAEEVAELKQRGTDAQSLVLDNGNLSRQLVELQSELLETQRALSGKGQEASSGTDASELRSEMLDLRKSLVDSLQEAEALRGAAAAQASIGDELGKERAEASNLRGRLGLAEASLARAEALRLDLEGQLSQARGEAARARQDVATARSQVDESNESQTKLAVDHEQALYRLQALEDEASTLRRVLAGRDADLEVSRANEDALRAECSISRSSKDKIMADLEAALAREAELGARLQTVESTIEHLKSDSLSMSQNMVMRLEQPSRLMTTPRNGGLLPKSQLHYRALDPTRIWSESEEVASILSETAMSGITASPSVHESFGVGNAPREPVFSTASSSLDTSRHVWRFTEAAALVSGHATPTWQSPQASAAGDVQTQMPPGVSSAVASSASRAVFSVSSPVHSTLSAFLPAGRASPSSTPSHPVSSTQQHAQYLSATQGGARTGSPAVYNQRSHTPPTRPLATPAVRMTRGLKPYSPKPMSPSRRA